MLNMKLSQRDKILIATGETSGKNENISSTLQGLNTLVYYSPPVATGGYSCSSPSGLT